MSNKVAIIEQVYTQDKRYPLSGGAGSDAVHAISEYCLAVTLLKSSSGLTGTGIVLTLGEGNRIVCELIELLAPALVGKEIEELMADFGTFLRVLSNHPQLRWLGPHKGAIHLALASITNACFDLWAKVRGLPLWKLLLELSPEQLVALLDLSYLEDVLTDADCLAILKHADPSRAEREAVLQSGYPGYDTSVGWIQYDDETLKSNIVKAIDKGFGGFKLKVGSPDPARDIRRAHILRDAIGDKALLMLDTNQQWTYPQAVEMCRELMAVSPYWIEEPTHPDDIAAHRNLLAAVPGLKIAAGEHVPNRVLFKNFMEAGALQFVQVDCTRVAGISEFLTVSLMAKKYGLPVVPHVGDMGQIHQHLVLFNHIGIGHRVEFLEYIPHLRPYFVHPAIVEQGRYVTPQDAGISSDLIGVTL